MAAVASLASRSAVPTLHAVLFVPSARVPLVVLRRVVARVVFVMYVCAVTRHLSTPPSRGNRRGVFQEN